MSKKWNIEVTCGSGKVHVILCNSKKRSDSEYSRLTQPGYKIYDGTQYTSNYTVRRVKCE